MARRPIRSRRERQSRYLERELQKERTRNYNVFRNHWLPFLYVFLNGVLPTLCPYLPLVAFGLYANSHQEDFKNGGDVKTMRALPIFILAIMTLIRGDRKQRYTFYVTGGIWVSSLGYLLHHSLNRHSFLGGMGLLAVSYVCFIVAFLSEKFKIPFEYALSAMSLVVSLFIFQYIQYYIVYAVYLFNFLLLLMFGAAYARLQSYEWNRVLALIGALLMGLADINYEVHEVMFTKPYHDPNHTLTWTLHYTGALLMSLSTLNRDSMVTKNLFGRPVARSTL